MLSRSSTLRVINISHNRLRFLPDTLFKDTQLEILDVSHNQISKIPDGCLSRIATTLRHLDASHNEITSITPDQVTWANVCRTNFKRKKKAFLWKEYYSHGNDK